MFLKHDEYRIESNSACVFNNRCSMEKMFRTFKPDNGVNQFQVFKNDQYLCSMWSIDGELKLIPENEPSVDYFKIGLALCKRNSFFVAFKEISSLFVELKH